MKEQLKKEIDRHNTAVQKSFDKLDEIIKEFNKHSNNKEKIMIRRRKRMNKLGKGFIIDSTEKAVMDYVKTKMV